MIVISHPTGNQNFRNAAQAFYQANRLARLFTTIAWNSQSSLAKMLPAGIVQTLQRRKYSQIPAELVATPHTAGPDVIADGEDGYIVPIRLHQAIAEKLELLANDRDVLDGLKAAALAKAQIFSWSVYRSKLIDSLGK